MKLVLNYSIMKLIQELMELPLYLMDALDKGELILIKGGQVNQEEVENSGYGCHCGVKNDGNGCYC